MGGLLASCAEAHPPHPRPARPLPKERCFHSGTPPGLFALLDDERVAAVLSILTRTPAVAVYSNFVSEHHDRIRRHRGRARSGGPQQFGNAAVRRALVVAGPSESTVRASERRHSRSHAALRLLPRASRRRSTERRE